MAKDEPPQSPDTAKADREAALAAALRANLRRRKAPGSSPKPAKGDE